MAELLRRIRQGIADTLRAVADEIDPVGTIEWGSSVGDAPITVGEPIQIPAAWLDWPGKADGAPCPGIISFSAEVELPRDTVECRAKFPSEGCEGCRRRLAPGQWWTFCGETDQGEGRALCRECGGDLELAP